MKQTGTCQSIKVNMTRKFLLIDLTISSVLITKIDIKLSKNNYLLCYNSFNVDFCIKNCPRGLGLVSRKLRTCNVLHFRVRSLSTRKSTG